MHKSVANRPATKVKALKTIPSTDSASFKEALRVARHIVVVAGAGLSAAPGIPTFRGAGGLWREYDATELATPDAFESDPALVWQFHEYRRRMWVLCLLEPLRLGHMACYRP